MPNSQSVLVPAAHAPSRPVQHQRLSPGAVEVRVDHAAQVDTALEEAITVVSPAAAEHQIGIMVTRMGAGVYMVRAHPEVPFGLTRQRYM